MDWTPEISTGIGSVDTVINPIITQTFAPNPATSANPLQILIPVAGIFWLAGIAAMLLYTAVSYFLLRRRVATAVLLRNNIYQSENVDSPFVLGIIKPKIYLPSLKRTSFIVSLLSGCGRSYAAPHPVPRWKCPGVW